MANRNAGVHARHRTHRLGRTHRTHLCFAWWVQGDEHLTGHFFNWLRSGGPTGPTGPTENEQQVQVHPRWGNYGPTWPLPLKMTLSLNSMGIFPMRPQRGAAGFPNSPFPILHCTCYRFSVGSVGPVGPISCIQLIIQHILRKTGGPTRQNAGGSGGSTSVAAVTAQRCATLNLKTAGWFQSWTRSTAQTARHANRRTSSTASRATTATRTAMESEFNNSAQGACPGSSESLEVKANV